MTFKEALKNEQDKVVIIALATLMKQQSCLIKCIALPGCGKTTTLLKATKVAMSKIKNLYALYLAYNNSIADEGRTKFPKRVDVRTINSYSRGYISRLFPQVNTRNIRNLKSTDIKKRYSTDFKVAKSVLGLFVNYCKDAETNLDKYLKINAAGTAESNYVKDIWNKMRTGEVVCTHDFYFKLFANALVEKQVTIKELDLLLFDEAQDANPIALQIFYAIPAKVKIIAGDKHQRIYSFNKSVNALLKKGKDSKVKEYTCFLTKTFRFQKNIGDKANKILQFFKGETNRIVCADIVKKYPPEYINTRAFISRTNSELIKKMISCVENDEVFITTRNPEEMFALIEDVSNLILGKKQLVKNYTVRDANSIEELKTHAADAEDVNLTQAIKIAEKEHEHISDLKKKALLYFEDKDNKYRKRDHLVLSTAHSCKGLEFDEVTIAGDFPDFAKIIHKLGYKSYENFLDNVADSNDSQIDEINLFFVALTRAIKTVSVRSVNNIYLGMNREMDVANEVNSKLEKFWKSKKRGAKWKRRVA